MEHLEPGARFGPYAVEGLIASGGMGQVYAARHDVYGSVCALKVLHAKFHEDADWRARFNEEGLVGTQLKHPRVLSARELVEHEGRVAIVMDLVKGGQTLEKVMAREFAKGLPLVSALQGFLAILQGIEYLHDKGIVHGDLKPENVMIEGEYRRPETWQPKVTDFGTVGLVAHPVVIDGRTAVVATPRYASPEHLRGVDRIEVRSDVYCLGLILHYLLSGVHCSDARTVREAAVFVLEPTPVVNLVDQPDGVINVFRKATAVAPEDRYASCRELALAVRKALDALGVTLDLEDVAADLATEVDEERAALQRVTPPDGAPALTQSERPTEIDPARRAMMDPQPPPAGAGLDAVPPVDPGASGPITPEPPAAPAAEPLDPVRAFGGPYPKGSDSEVTLEPADPSMFDDEASDPEGLDPSDSVVVEDDEAHSQAKDTPRPRAPISGPAPVDASTSSPLLLLVPVAGVAVGVLALGLGLLYFLL